MGIFHFPRSPHLNKPLSFYTSTCLTPFTFVVAGSQNCVSVTVFGNADGPAWTSVTPGGPGLGSQLPLAGHPWSRTVGTSQELLRAFLGEFPCIPSQGVSCLKCLPGERKWVSGKQRDRKTGYVELVCIPGVFCLCHLSFVALGSS